MSPLKPNIFKSKCHREEVIDHVLHPLAEHSAAVVPEGVEAQHLVGILEELFPHVPLRHGAHRRHGHSRAGPQHFRRGPPIAGRGGAARAEARQRGALGRVLVDGNRGFEAELETVDPEEF